MKAEELQLQTEGFRKQVPKFEMRPVVTIKPEQPLGSAILVKGYKSVVDVQRNNPVAIVSERYSLIQHKEVLDSVNKYLKSEMIESITMKTNPLATRIYVTAIFNTFNIHPKEGDTVKLGLKIINSVDATTSLMVLPYSFRLVCSNGMVHKNLMGGDVKRHLGFAVRVLENFDQVIEKSISQFNEIGNTYKKWTEVRIQPKQTFSTLTELGLFSKEYLKKIESPEIQTMWDLFNAFTKENSSNTRRTETGRTAMCALIERAMKKVLEVAEQ